MADPDLDETLPTTQGSTQPVSQDPGTDNSPKDVLSPVSQTYWGRLCPLSRRLKHHDLVESSITFGTKSSNTIVIHEGLVDKDYFKYLDSVHFRIERDSILIKGSNNFRRPKVDIHDLSRHGLFINGYKVGSGPRSISTPTKSGSASTELKNNDLISLPTNKNGIYDKKFDAYIFIDSYAPIPSHFPKSVVEQYHVSLKLGAGAFGEVHLTSNKATGQTSAMKAIVQSFAPDFNSVDKQRCSNKLLNELEILRTLDHPNVIKLNNSILHKNECFVFLEYMEGSDLAERISKLGRLPENITKILFYQICLGVQYLHSNRIIHRDIKPANVLLASRRSETLAKLTDFGLSKVLRSTENMRTLCGTRLYAAPELLSCKNEGKYTAQVDIWSLGVLLFVCLSGDDPFATEPHLIEKHIMIALYVMTPDVWKNVSIVAKNLVDSMLIIDPLKRIRLTDLLKDEWFQDANLHVKLKTLYEFYGHPLPEYNLKSTIHNPHKKIKTQLNEF